MRNDWEVDFAALNKAAGNGLRVLREDCGMTEAFLASRLHVSIETIHAYEAGLTAIPAPQLLIADRLFKAGGLDFFFWPYSRPELFRNSMENVLRFPKRRIS